MLTKYKEEYTLLQTSDLQQGMHLYYILLMMEFCPGVKAKAQVNSGAVNSKDDIIKINPEIVIINVKGS
jgi:hypothetical protein